MEVDMTVENQEISNISVEEQDLDLRPEQEKLIKAEQNSYR